MRYATRLNSFIVDGDVRAALRTVAGIKGVTDVDLNYPEHFDTLDPVEMRSLLDRLGLRTNSVAMRYRDDFVNGELTNPDPSLRRRAVDLTRDGIEAARVLGCDLVTIWQGFDGTDYAFQKDYAADTALIISTFQDLADFAPDVRLSIEYKPYEERVHALIPSLGSTLYLLDRIARPSVGATVDFAHMLMAGEAPGQGASLLLAEDRLFGVHLNDGNNAHDDGLMVASVHPWETAELLYYLLRYDYDGVIYFDTFPRREDPAREAQANIATTNTLVERITAYGVDRIREITASNDAIAVHGLRLALLGGSP
ncbi:sugar phosphate isomerase/epimerase [Actinomyces sp. 2119]|uniref:Sugar phosphate isomerase/epimerase n=1 Tax=Actinomyces lilanjuaniae TaxID=2321394 RepID=A0ABM6Z2H4_9ACTO|nr:MULTISPECIES: sugar phosphate isomerase/epimerase family protein [Actinomyces]AYD89475.1 sugar phosphate isomerase/epimerase [Actinomyces lilanjuaniae]RJF43166.1 sugar phosphate isomerase/epimerase [Actinomyces sp. 2119]